MLNRQVLLIKRPQGMVQESDFELKSIPVRPLEKGELLIKNEFISIDPAMRGWMNEGTTYMPGVALGTVVRGFAAGRIIASENVLLPVGKAVQGLTGVQEYAVSDGKNITLCDENKAPVSWYLGILGMPGMTAYFGLLEKGKPKEGETVLISGAAGVVGSTAGQIAKIKGCNVIGIAGGKAKCNYLLGLGFNAVIDYKSEDVAAALKKIAPTGVDIFFDNIGGEQLDIALMNLARGARVVICGAISQYNDVQKIQGPKNYMKIVTARGVLTGIIVFDYLDEYPRAVTEISNWIKEGKLHYREHVVEGLEQYNTALQMLFRGENFGKLILKI